MSKVIYSMFAAALFLTMSSCSAQQKEQPAIDTVMAGDTTAKKTVFYVDVRTPAEFAQGSVPGAVNIPLDQVASRIDEFKGKEEIVVFCRSGNRSSQAKSILEQNGITNVTNGGSWEDVRDRAVE